MRRAIISLGLAVTLAVVGFLSTPASASAQQRTITLGSLVLTPNIPGSGTFNIHNYGADGKCIGIDASNNAGDWNCTTNADQLWHWGAAISSGWNQLVNGNGKCLGVLGGADGDGAQVVAWDCLGTDHTDQYWSVGNSIFGDNYSTILNYKAYNDPSSPAELIGVSGGSTGNGAPLVLWGDTGTPDQSWY